MLGGGAMKNNDDASPNNDKTEMTTISFLVHESITVKQERTIKRLLTALVFAIALMFLSNAIWLWAWMQYDYVSSDVTVDSQNGIATYATDVGGSINYGTDYSQTENEDSP